MTTSLPSLQTDSAGTTPVSRACYHPMQAFHDMLDDIVKNGKRRPNRTGVGTLFVPGRMLKFDLERDGFPAITTKFLPFKAAKGELVGFFRGYDNAAQFRSIGCKVWDQNANENRQWLANPYRTGEDDLGPVYGVQWRNWPAYKVLSMADTKQIDDAMERGYQMLTVFDDGNGEGKRAVLYKAIDQLRQCLDTIMSNPGDRRIIFHGWNWAQLEEMALPPCHLLYQFLVNKDKQEISLCLYIRSNDVGLGTPFNLTEGAALLHLVGRLTGYKPRWFTYFIGDAHIYENHVDMLQEQLKREPFAAPKLVLSDRIPDFAKTGKYEPEWLEKVEPSDFSLEGYEHHPPLTAPMAV